MQALTERMRLHGSWVLGLPVYWWGPTAQFKAFLDRWYLLDQRRDIFGGRRVAFAIPSRGGPANAQHTVGILEEVAAYLGMDHRSTLLPSASGRRGAIGNRADVMKEARDLGSRLVT